MNYGDTSNDFQSLEGWVISKCEQWRDHFESNYQYSFDEYYRLWRGIWAEEDSLRSSERSRLISPALQQAVESSVAEVEEATFGRGKWFDIKDDFADQQPQDIQLLRNQLTEDMQFANARKSIAECLINSAVFGTGIGEIVLEEITETRPATQPIMDGNMTAVGVMESSRTLVKLRPILPQNFLIDPVATSIDEALGVAIDEFVPLHQVETAQQKGVYRDVDIAQAVPDVDLEPDQDLTMYLDDRVRLTKYYGLVPRDLFEAAFYEGENEDRPTDEEFEDYSPYVEAIVIIANGGTLLKIEENPYMMQDRPVVAFPWDVVPSRFWGRGICEKGYNAQKALDTELRARIDALALTVHPMLAVDASRLPRGSKLEVRPGKAILTNGNPSEVLQPFRFGNLDANTFNQASSLQQMVQMATGAIDAAGIPGSINGDATAAGISMSLGAIIKRHKRTLINFQDSFLLPFVKKAAYRYMQFNPELYPVADFKFVASSSLGIIAREYEVTQLVQLLQTMSPDSPMYPLLIESIVDNMNLSNREQIIDGLRQSNQQQRQQKQQQSKMLLELDMAQKQESIKNIQAQTAEIESRVQQNAIESQLLPLDAETRRLAVQAKGGPDEVDKEFERRAKLAELVLKEREIASKEEIVETQMRQVNGSN
tara:strand:+ start:318 stop:2279 length:1962 start_codon:yes stop_codon:yes gene_type:complete